jgi:hypothetical protein
MQFGTGLGKLLSRELGMFGKAAEEAAERMFGSTDEQTVRYTFRNATGQMTLHSIA